MNKPLLVRWIMRPVPIRSVDEVQFDMITKKIPNDKQQINQDPYAFLNTFIDIGWEISMSHNRHDYLYYKEDISYLYAQRKITDLSIDWCSCSTIIQQPVKKGIISVKAFVQCDKDVTFHPSRQFLGFEWRDVQVQPLDISEYHYLGGDPEDENTITNSALAQVHCHNYYSPFLTQKIYKDHEVIRAFAWKFRTLIGKVNWSSKLMLSELLIDDEGKDIEYEAKEESKNNAYHYNHQQEEQERLPRDHAVIDYEMIVSVYIQHVTIYPLKRFTCNGILRQREQQQFQQQQKQQKEQQDSNEAITLNITSSNTYNSTSSMNLLSPWIWQSFEIEVQGLRHGDYLIISGKPIYSLGSSSSDVLTSSTATAAAATISNGAVSNNEIPPAIRRLLKRCQIRAERCKLFTKLGDYSDYDHTNFNEIVPIFEDPRYVYFGFHDYIDEQYQNEEELAEAAIDKDRARPILEQLGVDTKRLHNTQLQPLIDAYAEESYPEDEFFTSLYEVIIR
jgi:hypothetical protein